MNHSVHSKSSMPGYWERRAGKTSVVYSSDSLQDTYADTFREKKDLPLPDKQTPPTESPEQFAPYLFNAIRTTHPELPILAHQNQQPILQINLLSSFL